MKFSEIKVLVACEESQVVCKAFRKLGIEAYSCDLLDCSGRHPEWHIKDDAIKVAYDKSYNWTLMIAHPPCTYLSKAGARWMYPTAGQVDFERLMKTFDASVFFYNLLAAPIKHIAIENPTPLKIAHLPEPSQAIQPYEFGHPYSKRTLLWLRNLPFLVPTNILDDYVPFMPSNTGGKKRGQKHSRGIAKNAQEASTTFEGVAEAMATQWSEYILNYA